MDRQQHQLYKQTLGFTENAMSEASFSTLLADVDHITLPRADLIKIEKAFVRMEEIGSTMGAICKSLDHMADCKNAQADAAFVAEYGQNEYVRSGLVMGLYLLSSMGARCRYDILDLLDKRIEQASAKKTGQA